MSDKILVHIPHSSMTIPIEYAGSFSADSKTIEKNLIALTDFSTDDLFNHPKHQNRLIFPVSRLLCDVERFEKDEDEIMAKIGMGVVYTKGINGEILRPFNKKLRQRVIDQYYRPHHKKLLEEVRRIVDENKYCIIIDAHSFPSKPSRYELDQDTKRADFCIGTDRFHTPRSLVRVICDCIVEMGYSVEENKPFSGTIVPLDLYGSKVPVFSVMIEVNRCLYMDEVMQTRNEHYESVKKAIGKIIDVIDGWVLED
jgi:N-formylglutamate deformylase